MKKVVPIIGYEFVGPRGNGAAFLYRVPSISNVFTFRKYYITYTRFYL